MGRPPLARDLLPAVLLAAYGAFEVLSGVAPGVGEVPGDPRAGVAAGAVAGAAVALRRSRPLVGLAVATAGAIAEAAVTDPAEGLAPLLAGLVLVYAVGARCSQRAAFAGLLGSVTALGYASGDAVFVGVVYAVPWLAGRVLGERQRQLLSLQATSAANAQRAVEDERARIARELHDVVSHALSLVVVQAQVAQATVRTDPAAAEQALVAVKDAGQRALADMRAMLDVLELGGPAGSRQPQPDLAALPALLESVRAAGLVVRLDQEGAQRDLPPGVALTAYRVVQEGLTNALRHAAAGQVRVLLGWTPESVVVRVTDEGPADDGAGGTPRAGAGAGAGAGGGRGLTGLRQRVAGCGGTLSAGPTGNGGYRLEAVLPG